MARYGFSSHFHNAPRSKLGHLVELGFFEENNPYQRAIDVVGSLQNLENTFIKNKE